MATNSTTRPTAQNTSFHERWLQEQLADPDFREEFEREQRELRNIDAIVNKLDTLREQQGMTKAKLAREIGKNPASVRRMLTAPGNPELRTVVAMAEALDAEIIVRPRGRRRGRDKQPA